MLDRVVTISTIGLLQRLRRLNSAQRALLIRASMMLGLALGGRRLLPFRVAIPFQLRAAPAAERDRR